MKNTKHWIFVVDTEQYSGNFERDMGAYLTGVTGEYFGEQADALAKLHREENPFKGDESPFAAMLGIHEGDGEHEPSYVSIWPTPGWFNDGLGGHFRDGQEAEAQEHYRAACLDRIGKTNYARQEDADRENKRWTYESEKPVRKHPAYLSVAIMFDKEPSSEQELLLRRLAAKFPEVYERDRSGHRSPVTVTGTRLIEKETTYTVVGKFPVTDV